MKLVIDASVAVKWLLPDRPGEKDVELADCLLEMLDRPEHELFAPPHWISEVLSVIARVESAAIEPTVELLHDTRPTVVTSRSVVLHGAKLAASLDHHLFDTLYHAVAMEVGATLVTADERYHAKAKSLGAITMLASFRP